jgi:BCD family chlorophyll transporter-like MFS transporter
LLGFVFACYGICIAASSTPFAALLVDISDEDNRSQLVGIVWSMLMVGIVAGAITSEKILEGLTPETLQASINRLFLILPTAVLLLNLLATVGIEKKYSRYHQRSSLSDREDQITLGAALKILTASRQTGIFFAFMLVMTVSLFLQQPVLEPYAREVFGLSIGESAGINKFWGYGILLGMTITGFWIVPRLGKQRTAQLGCLVTASSFGFVIASGLTQKAMLLQSAVMFFGLGSGILTNSAVSLMLDLTAAETAGTFIGAWGLAQAMAQASATVAGGALLDLGRRLLPNTFLAFSLVFVCQALGLVVATLILKSVNVKEFREDSDRAIRKTLLQTNAAVMASELD